MVVYLVPCTKIRLHQAYKKQILNHIKSWKKKKSRLTNSKKNNQDKENDANRNITKYLTRLKGKS